jgi:hypothetical protein
VAWVVILAVGWTVAGLLTVILIGFILFPVMIVLTFVPFAHMGYAAYKVSQGIDYRYPWTADLVSARGFSTSPVITEAEAKLIHKLLPRNALRNV